MRIVFVLDRVPTALLRIVEFLNKHLDTVETYALEVRRHIVSDAEPPILEISRRGVSASDRSQASRTQHPVLTLDAWEERFRGRHGDDKLTVAKAIIDWMSTRGRVFVTKSGDPSVGLQIPGSGIGRYPLFVKANGRLAVTFTYLMQRSEFSGDEMRAAAARRMLEIVEGNGRYGGPTGDVTVELAPLIDNDKRERFLREIQNLVDLMAD